MYQILSKTQAHEVVVPWQHQPVSEEASAGRTEEPVDVIGGGDNGTMSSAVVVSDTVLGGGNRRRYFVSTVLFWFVVAA